MNLNQLKYFLAAAEMGSISAAAQQFFITPQAMNSSLRKLEQELDSVLFQRDSKGVLLTPQGHLFLTYAQNIVQQCEEAVYELKRFEASKLQLNGIISIFSASIFTDLFVPDIIRDFTAIYPDTMIKIIEIDNGELFSYIVNGYCDLALLSSSKNYIEKAVAEAKQTSLKCLTLLEDKMVVCARKDHPLMRYKELNYDILDKYAKENSFRHSLYQILPFNSVEISYAYSVSNSNNADLHKKLMSENVAVTYMPNVAYQYKFQKDGFAALPLEGTPTLYHSLLYREDSKNWNDRLLPYFVEFLQRKFQKQFKVYR